MRIDCSHPPAAVLTVVGAGKTLKLRTANYKALVLVGADDFSCQWPRRRVIVNYKAGGKADGDLFRWRCNDEWVISDGWPTFTRFVKGGCVIVKDEPEVPRCYMKDPYGLIYNLTT